MDPLPAFCPPFLPAVTAIGTTFCPLPVDCAPKRRPALRKLPFLKLTANAGEVAPAEPPRPTPAEPAPPAPAEPAPPAPAEPAPPAPAEPAPSAPAEPAPPAPAEPAPSAPAEPAPPTPTEPAPTAPAEPAPPGINATESSATPEDAKPAPADPPKDGGNNNNGNNNNNNNNNKDDKPSDGPDDKPDPVPTPSVPPADPGKPRSPVQATLDKTSVGFKAFLTNVPPPVLVAMISFVSTMSAARYKAYYDNQKVFSIREADSKKHKEQVERDLRATYERLSAPLLKSTAKLCERLRFIVESDWESVEDSVSTDPAADPAKAPVSDLSPMYSTYLLARFLSHAHILKTRHDLLDFGFPTADRILSNILARIQGVLGANDAILVELQATEHFFKPPPNARPLAAGPLKLSPRTQTVLGELMLRRHWSGRADYVEKDDASGGTSSITSPVLSFLEFSRLLEDHPVMQQFFRPVITQFAAMEKFSRATPPSGRARRDDRIGSRLFILQSALNDLMDFFDPLPNAKAIPIYQRERLSLGDATYDEEQRIPLSIRLLYQELAGFRDGREMQVGAAGRLRLPHEVEVFVTGAYDAGDPRVELAVKGNCPYSHRVMIALKEMGITHKTVPISMDSKPAWFYLLQPQSSTPVIYHDGNVIMESGNIVGYLTEKFAKARPDQRLASADHLKLAVGTAAFTRFHPHFIRWLGGDESAKAEMAQELEKLDLVLREAQAKNNGKPFLGGSRFSREDTAIAPCLHNVEVAARMMKKWGLPNDLHAVWKYLHAARKQPSFKYSGAREEAVVRRFRAINSGSYAKSGMSPLAHMPE